MKKAVIMKTAICRYVPEEKAFVVGSPLLDNIIGADETEDAAWAVFGELVDDFLDAIRAGEVVEHARPGRPAKNIVKVTMAILPDVRDKLKERADELGISQGDFVNFAVRLADADLEKKEQSTNNVTKKAV